MNEAVTEQVEKKQADEQWNKYHSAEGNGKTQALKPSEKQKSYIVQLGRRVGVKVNVSSIDSRAKASRIIDQLRLLQTRMSGNGQVHGSDMRDKRVAFGMATKLVYKKYLDRHKEVRRSKKFWDEVGELYRDYEKHQEAAVSGFSNASDLAATA